MKRLLYLLYILAVLIVLIPKEKLYYTMERALEPYHLYFANETLNNRFFYFDADGVSVILDHSAIATIERIRIAPWIVSNRLVFSSIEVSPEYKLFFPGKIDEIEFVYSLIHPLSIRIEGRGEFGECHGIIDPIEGKIRLEFDRTAQLRAYAVLVSKLRAEKEKLVYESDF